MFRSAGLVAGVLAGIAVARGPASWLGLGLGPAPAALATLVLLALFLVVTSVAAVPDDQGRPGRGLTLRCGELASTVTPWLLTPRPRTA